MNRKNIFPLLAPIVGMLPVIVFFVATLFFSYNIALMAALATFLLYFFVDLVILKNSPPYTILLSIISFVLLVCVSQLQPFKLLYIHQASLVLELLTIIVFAAFFFIRNFFRGRILMKNSKTSDFLLIRFDSDIYVIKAVLYVLIGHLLMVLVYQLLPFEYKSAQNDRFVYFIVLYILVCFHLGFELFRFSQLQKRIATEEWLPIVNEGGAVQGKIAWSVTRDLGNKYLHPIIRIALIHKGMIYLKERPPFFIIHRGKLDYPFESYLMFKQTLADGVKQTLLKYGAKEDLKTQFIFRYVSENIETNRLIYLYSCVVSDESTIRSMDLGEGKFWTSKQIEENLGTGIFSEYFEKEYELLENTVLLADKIMNDLNEPE